MKSVKKQVYVRVMKEVIRQERNHFNDQDETHQVIWLVRNQLTDKTWEQIWERVRVLLLLDVV